MLKVFVCTLDQVFQFHFSFFIRWNYPHSRRVGNRDEYFLFKSLNFIYLQVVPVFPRLVDHTVHNIHFKYELCKSISVCMHSHTQLFSFFFKIYPKVLKLL